MAWNLKDAIVVQCLGCQAFAHVLLLDVAKLDDLLCHIFVVLDGEEAILRELVVQIRFYLFRRSVSS